MTREQSDTQGDNRGQRVTRVQSDTQGDNRGQRVTRVQSDTQDPHLSFKGPVRPNLVIISGHLGHYPLYVLGLGLTKASVTGPGLDQLVLCC